MNAINKYVNYRSAEGLNYSLLKEFWKSPDHAIMPFNDSVPCMLGRAFECIVFDKALGGNRLEKFFIITSLKTRGTSKAWVKEAEESERKLIKEDEYDMLLKMTEHVLGLTFKNITIQELLQASIISVPVFWKTKGVQKKAEIDFLVEIDNQIYPFDLKSFCGEINTFQWSIRDYGYWIQDIHYCEGLQHYFPNKFVNKMTFVVASKKEPFLSKCWQIADETREFALYAYQQLVDRFVEWNQAGRPTTGFDTEVGEANFKLAT